MNPIPSDSLISIIIPCYNQAKYLPEALESVLAQTHQHWECIIVNDGSTDNTDEVAKEWLTKDERFKYLSMKNGGPSASRNAGIKSAKGEYIQFLDADDLLENNKIAYHLNCFEKESNHIDIAISGYRYFKESYISEELLLFGPSDILPETVITKDDKKDVLKLFANKNPMVISAPLFKKRVFSVVGLFDENLRAVEDWDFHFRCALAKMVFHHTGYQKGTKTLIRLHGESAMNDKQKFKQNIALFREKHRDNPNAIVKTRDGKALRIIKLFIPPIVSIVFNKLIMRNR